MDLTETAMTALVARTLDSVTETGGMGLITAPQGAGKSVSVMMAARDRRHVKRVVLVEGLSSPRALYRHVAMTLGIDAPTQAGAADLVTAVSAEVKRHDYLLVLDQCQRLKRPNQFDQVACLVDLLPALVLVGPPALRSRVQAHEECVSLCTVPLQLARGVEMAELQGALGGQFSEAWLEHVWEASAGCWRRIHAAVAAAQRAMRRTGRDTRELGAEDAEKLVGAIMLNPSPVTRVTPKATAAQPKVVETNGQLQLAAG